MNLFWSFLLSSLIYLFQQPRISSDTKRGFYWSKFHVRETIYIRRTDLIYPPLSRTKPLKDVGAVDLRIGGSEICFNGILRSSLRIFIAPALFWDSWFFKKSWRMNTNLFSRHGCIFTICCWFIPIWRKNSTMCIVDYHLLCVNTYTFSSGVQYII